LSWKLNDLTQLTSVKVATKRSGETSAPPAPTSLTFLHRNYYYYAEINVP